jgi:hypothetical protein
LKDKHDNYGSQKLPGTFRYIISETDEVPDFSGNKMVVTRRRKKMQGKLASFPQSNDMFPDIHINRNERMNTFSIQRAFSCPLSEQNNTVTQQITILSRAFSCPLSMEC